MKRRNFNKLMASLPLLGALPFSVAEAKTKDNRIFYATEKIEIGEIRVYENTPDYTIKSVNISTKFELEQVFGHGQLAIYENMCHRPEIDVDITIQRGIEEIDYCLRGYEKTFVKENNESHIQYDKSSKRLCYDILDITAIDKNGLSLFDLKDFFELKTFDVNIYTNGYQVSLPNMFLSHITWSVINDQSQQT